MEALAFYLTGFPAFAAYLAISLGMLVAFMAVYSLLTPHHEWTLMRQGNIAAAIAYGGTTIGFALPLYSAMANAMSLKDFMLWSVISAAVQIMTFFAIRIVLRLQNERLSNHISEGHLAYGILVACISIAAGILNAAAMTY